MKQTEAEAKSIPLIAGLLAGGTSTVLLYPLDLVKVRLQVNESPKGIDPKVSWGSNRNFVNTLRNVVKHEGFVGIYQGLTPALIGSAVSWGGYFFFYEGLKKNMLERKQKSKGLENQELSSIDTFSAACLSGAIMVACTNPLWLIKTRMQLQTKLVQTTDLKKLSNAASTQIKIPYKNIFDAFFTIVREEGIVALYKGSIPALMLVSHGGVQFMVYEGLKKQLGVYTKASKSAGDSGSNVVQRLKDSVGYLTMGAVSKVIASTVTYPLQLIKSRLQQRTQITELTIDGEIQIVRREYSGVMDCVRRIWRHEGFVGFFKGTIPNAVRVAPSSAITFVVYESVTDFLTKKGA